MDQQCRLPEACPLSRIQPGTTVRITQLSVPPEAILRLREMGLREQQKVELLAHNRSVICKVCNMRLGLSADLADAIWVEPVSAGESIE